MSEMAKQARRAMRAKAIKMAGADPHKRVDASSWTPPEAINADRKGGARPIRPKIYRNHGGVIALQGDRGPKRLDRKPRANGGEASTGGSAALSMRDTAGANKKAFGSYHDGGYRKGGRTKRDMGGLADPRDTANQALQAAGARAGVPASRMTPGTSRASPFLKDGGAAPKGKRLVSFYAGGEAAKKAVHKHEGRLHKGEPKTELEGGGRTQRADGGKALTGGTRPTGGRIPHAKGGRTKGGKTNIVIKIAQPPPTGGMMPPAPVRPPPMPPPMPPGGAGGPPGGMPGGGGPPIGGPPPGLGGPPGGPPGLPPGLMGRARGGRAPNAESIDLVHAGSGSGEGRLEKAAIQKRSHRQRGGVAV